MGAGDAALTTGRDGAAVDPLDPVAAPFGAFAPTPMLARLRAAALGGTTPALLRRVAVKALAHFSKGRIADVTYLGAKRRVFLGENAQDRWVFRRGAHPEEEELLSFAKEAGRRAVFLDIGANNGYFAVQAALTLGAGARVIAFEPHPRTYRKLLLALALNDLGADAVEPVNAALGAEETEAPMATSDQADGMNTLSPKRGASEDSPLRVPVLPLTAALERRGVDRVDILKIDVEGYEPEVLFPFFETAREALWPRRVIIEAIKPDKRWSRDCRALLAERGYAVAHASRNNLWLTRAPAASAGAPPGQAA